MKGLAPLGFVLNISNPVNFFVWLALHSTLVAGGLGALEQRVFLLSSLIGIFVIEVIIAILAKWILKNLSPTNSRRLQILVSMVFLIAGISVLYLGLA